jgi:hypothetical protein
MCDRISLDRDVLQCNAVLFCQDSMDSVARMLTGEEMFDKDGLVSLLRIYLLDDKGNLDRLARIAFACSDLLARPWVVCQWISVLTYINVAYKGCWFPDTGTIFTRITSANKEIRRRAFLVDDRTTVESDAAIGSDVANTQGREVSRPTAGHNFNTGHTSMRTTCVMPSPTRCFDVPAVRTYAQLNAIYRCMDTAECSVADRHTDTVLLPDSEEGVEGTSPHAGVDNPVRNAGSESNHDSNTQPPGGFSVEDIRREFSEFFGDEEYDSDDDSLSARGIRRC